jgi:hypothetical protein
LVGFFTSVESFPLVTSHVLLVSTCFFVYIQVSWLAQRWWICLCRLDFQSIHMTWGHFLSICANMFTMLVFTISQYLVDQSSLLLVFSLAQARGRGSCTASSDRCRGRRARCRWCTRGVSCVWSKNHCKVVPRNG